MPSYDVYDLDKSSVGSVEINSDLLEYPIKEHLLHTVVTWQLARSRSGTASTKTRGEVRGGGAKPWKQKNMGRARHGSIRSPLWRKGGVTFGPKPRDWSFNIPKKIRRQALKGALSIKHGDGKILVIKEFNLSRIETKQIEEFLRKFELDDALILLSQENENLELSARNIKSVKVLKVEGLNVYDVLRFDSLVITEDAIQRLEEVYKN
ncbi:50S ribosomal protein L4 [Desulfobacterota bacterium AH_259_B03_O07]|nr:50S ribosomal protein L4 [Desulfobacterota bacterium AH_259_B03_O07]